MVNKKKQESGRSMVEMLGVLAIIGVLSIGGIAGYTLAMRRHRANNVIDAINKYASLVYASCQRARAQGDLTGTNSCLVNTHYLPYNESGLAPINELSDIAVGTVGTDENGVDYIRVLMRFNDLAVCNAAKNILRPTGEGYCMDTNDSFTKSLAHNFKQN